MKELLLGEAIKRRRLELGLTQEQLCEGLCDPATLCRLENNRQTPTHNRIKAILQRLNMPDDRYYALLSPHELELASVRKEFVACHSRFARAEPEQKKQLWELTMEQLHRLEGLAEDDDAITRQFILNHRVILGTPDGPYSFEERWAMLLEALRLTVPKFDLERIEGRRYSVDETRLISQIAVTYSREGKHTKALEIYSQLFDYVRKNDDHLSNFAPHFTLIAHNYARELALCAHYQSAIEIAEQGRRVSVDYGHYQFFPGFLAAMGECYYQLGEEEKSKKLCVQAHYIYEALGDERNLALIDPDIKSRFQIEFPV